MYYLLRDEVHYDQVWVAENGDYYHFSEDRFPGHYYAWLEDDKMVVAINYEAYNEQKTFTIGFTAHNAVEVHQDVAELYWQFIGDDWLNHAEKATVLITLPADVSEDDLQVWGHGPLHGNVEILNERQIYYEVYDLPAGNFLEARVLFPPEIVPDAVFLSHKEALPDIIAEEDRWAREGQAKRFLYLAAFILGPLAFGAALITAVILWSGPV